MCYIPSMARAALACLASQVEAGDGAFPLPALMALAGFRTARDLAEAADLCPVQVRGYLAGSWPFRPSPRTAVRLAWAIYGRDHPGETVRAVYEACDESARRYRLKKGANAELEAKQQASLARWRATRAARNEQRKAEKAAAQAAKNAPPPAQV